MIDFTASDEKDDVAARSTALKLTQELRSHLSENGIDVLDRLASVEVGNEQELAKNGLTGGDSRLPPMLGADYVVNGQWSITGKTLRISILTLHGGKLAAEKTFNLPVADAPGLSGEIIKWVLSGVGGNAAADQLIWAPVDGDGGAGAVPTVESHCSNKAKPLEASAEFEKAYVINDRFQEAFMWEARCYEAAGLQPLADMLRRFLHQNLLEHGVGEVITTAPVDGLTFLGVVDNGASDAACRKLEILATDAVSGSSQRVLLPGKSRTPARRIRRARWREKFAGGELGESPRLPDTLDPRGARALEAGGHPASPAHAQ